jgi:hypothetical protein
VPDPPDLPGQRSLFTASQAQAAGWTSAQLETAVRREELSIVARSVYAPTDLVASLPDVERHLLDVRAAILSAGPGWHAARRSAALLHGLPLIGRTPVAAQLLRDVRGRGKGRDRHERIARLPTTQRQVVDDVPVVSVARTVVDMARQEGFRNGLVAADAALRKGSTREELRAVLAGQRRWPGVVVARAVVRAADGRAESPGESVTRAALYLEGLPPGEPQVEVWRYGAFVARVDLLLAEQLLVVESDGAIKFTGAGVLPALLERQESIRDCGLEVVRTSWGETFKDTRVFGDRMRDRIAAAPMRRLAPGVRLVPTTLHRAARPATCSTFLNPPAFRASRTG